jgi:hypothetical protein
LHHSLNVSVITCRRTRADAELIAEVVDQLKELGRAVCSQRVQPSNRAAKHVCPDTWCENREEGAPRPPSGTKLEEYVGRTGFEKRHKAPDWTFVALITKHSVSGKSCNVAVPNRWAR